MGLFGGIWNTISSAYGGLTWMLRLMKNFVTKAPPLEYVTIDKLEQAMVELDDKFKLSTLRGISFDRSSNERLGLSDADFEYTVFSLNPIETPTGDGIPTLPRLYERYFTSLSPSQTSFVNVIEEGLRHTDTETVLIDVASLGTDADYWRSEYVVEVEENGVKVTHQKSVIKLINEALAKVPASKRVVVRLLIGSPLSQEKENERKWCFLKKTYEAIFWGSSKKDASITHQNAYLYVGYYNPDFDVASDDSNIENVRAFVTKVAKSNLVKDGTKAAQLFNSQNLDVDKMVNDLFVKNKLKGTQCLSWNHGKILAVNGRTLMTGGINYGWNYTNVGDCHICDHAVKLVGDATVSAHKWADYFWKYLQDPVATDKMSFSYWTKLSEPPAWTRSTKGSIPDSSAFQKVIKSKKFESLTVGKLGDWSGDMRSIQYPIQVIDGVRDMLLNLAWHTINPKNKSTAGYEFMLLAKFLSDEGLTNMGYFQELGINPMAWASRFSRNLAIKYARDNVVMSQQMLVQSLTVDKKDLKAMVEKWSQKAGILDDKLKPLPGKEAWSGAVWGFDILIALAVALGRISKSVTSKDPPLNDKNFDKECKGIYIVVSTNNPNGRHTQEEGWHDQTSVWQLKKRLKIIMQNLSPDDGGIDAKDIDTVLNKYLHIKRTDTEATTTKRDLYNHSKIVAVDRKVMYVGSDNAYPSYNEEHGVWIDHQDTIDHWLDTFFVPFWRLAKEPTALDATGSLTTT